MPTKKPLYTATFTHEGKRYYVRSATSRRDAEKRAAQRQIELQQGLVLLDGGMLVDDYFLQWVDTYKKHVVCQTVYKQYWAKYKARIGPVIGRMKIKDVRPLHIQQILNGCSGCSQDYCRKVSGIVKALFAQAVEDDLIRKTPAKSATLPAAKNGTHRSITAEERRAILAAAPHHRFGLFVLIMLWCGLRPQEVAVLQWTDIDEVDRRILVRRALKSDQTVGPPKTDAGMRDVPIPPQLWELLSPGSLPIRTIFGGVYTSSPRQIAWDSFKRQVNIELGARTDAQGLALENRVAPDLTLYCLRHTYCTDLEAAGVPINVAKYLMGHGSISVTSQIYTHMRDDTLANATQKINAFAKQAGATTGATQKGEITQISGRPQNPEIHIPRDKNRA